MKLNKLDKLRKAQLEEAGKASKVTEPDSTKLTEKKIEVADHLRM